MIIKDLFWKGFWGLFWLVWKGSRGLGIWVFGSEGLLGFMLSGEFLLSGLFGGLFLPANLSSILLINSSMLFSGSKFSPILIFFSSQDLSLSWLFWDFFLQFSTSLVSSLHHKEFYLSLHLNSPSLYERHLLIHLDDQKNQPK